jgi:hypothetical protein
VKIYKFANPQRHLAIISLLIILISLLLVIVYKNAQSEVIGFIWLAIILMGIIAIFTFGTITNKIILSPKGFNYVSFGISLLMAWDTVEKVVFDDYGIVNILFKEAIFQNHWVNKILLPIASGHAIQLSVFIDDLTSSNLVRDIKYFAPGCDISEIEEQLAKAARNN